MNPSPLTFKESLQSPSFLACCFLVLLAGLACFALPPYLIPGSITEPAYGHPLIPWFATAFANFLVLPSMAAYFVLGLIAGFCQPRRWLILGFLALALPPLFQVINIIGDVRVDSTDHNLFPLEFAILAFLSWPAILGTFLGSLIGRRRMR